MPISRTLSSQDLQMIMAGPVSSTSPGGLGWFGYILFGVVACTTIWALVRDWRRTKELRQYAEDKGFKYAPEECFGPIRFGPFLKTEKVGEWALIYRSKERLPLEEIDALLALGLIATPRPEST
jgi:hypothetical protein